ncbi:MAG TPA: N-acetyltransferase [Microvirga sp.]|nr:N-acetyltransferase [Microvirga sp.]
MTTPVAIRPETQGDRVAIHDCVRAAFGRPEEADLVARLRRDGDLVLSLVAEDAGAVLGQATFSRLFVENGRATALAPVGVTPARRGQGVGGALIREGLRLLAERGEDVVLVLGDPQYYGRFGFTAEAAQALKTPYDGPYQQALALGGRSLAGAVRYPAAFADLT